MAMVVLSGMTTILLVIVVHLAIVQHRQWRLRTLTEQLEVAINGCFSTLTASNRDPDWAADAYPDNASTMVIQAADDVANLADVEDW